MKKNTSRALRNQSLNNQYWNLLNHAPPKSVNTIVTDRVLSMDKRSCDNLLKGILQEKRDLDQKHQTMQIERQKIRNKLKMKHNERIIMAEKLGVKNKSTNRGNNESFQGFSDFQKSLLSSQKD